MDATPDPQPSERESQPANQIVFRAPPPGSLDRVIEAPVGGPKANICPYIVTVYLVEW